MALDMAKRSNWNTANTDDISTSHRDIVDNKYRELRRPKKLRFYANGDRYFKGRKLYITPHRYVNFQDLLNDLTDKLGNNVSLPYGVRQIYTPAKGKRVRDIEELQDGSSYVCAGFEAFRGLRYGGDNGMEPWTITSKGHQHDFYRPPMEGFQPSPRLRQSFPTRRLLNPGTFGSRQGPGSYWASTSRNNAAGNNLRPKVITVVRNGSRPRTNVKILLNKRGIQSFEQLIYDISEAFGPKFKNDKVQNLYTLKGKEIKGVGDVFRDDDVFIGVGTETVNSGDIADILEELFPNSPYAKNYAKQWDKNRRKAAAKKMEDDSGIGSEGSHQLEDEQAKKAKRKNLEIQRKFADEEREKVRRKKEADAADPEKKWLGYGVHNRRDEPKIIVVQKGEHAEGEKQQQKLTPRSERTKKEKPVKGVRLLLIGQGDNEDDENKKPSDDDNRNSNRSNKNKDADGDGKSTERNPPKKTARIKDDDKGDRDDLKNNNKNDDDNNNNNVKKKKPKKEKKEKTDSETNQQEKPYDSSEKKIEKSDFDNNNNNNKNNNNNNKEKTDGEKPRKKKEKTENKENKEPPTSTAVDEDTKKSPNEKEKTKPMHRKKSKQIVYKTKAQRQIPNTQAVWDKYELTSKKPLGDGNFAVVKACRLKKPPNTDYAMKIIDKSKLKGKEAMIENEIEIMKSCNHPNICKLFEEYETTDEIYLIMELVKGGDLFDAITQSVKFGEQESSSMVNDLAQALFYLHSRNIVHRDLKPENLLVHRNTDGTISLKLADFGLAMQVNKPLYTVCGTPTYVAPEILMESGYGLEIDMWAVGVITYILLCGFPPFRSPDRNQTELFEFIKAGEFEFLMPYWDGISKQAKDLIEKLLVVNIKKRYTAIDVLCHAWIITRAGSVPGPNNLSEYQKKHKQDLFKEAELNLESYNNEKRHNEHTN